jgi:hypothetical protein
MDSWWYCLKHNRVEEKGGCPNSERLGPFATENEAARSLERARERNEEWDRREAEWDKGQSREEKDL